MGNHPVIPFFLVAVLAMTCASPAPAQSPLDPPGISFIAEPNSPIFEAAAVDVGANASEMFACGNWELQVLTGMYLRSSLGPDGPDFDYLPFSLRLGRIWTPPRWEGSPLIGSFETLLELTTAPVTSGPGNIIVGPSLLLRRNILWSPTQRCVPYLQGGAGIIYTDAADDRSQSAIGQEMEFLLQAQLGLRTRISPHCTLDVEGGYQHISNACLSDRNGGVNNFGISVGFTFTLPYRR